MTTYIDTGEATRDRILRLADALFARRGYAAVSMRHVAIASGVTKPALYYHFVDKDALFTECVLINQMQLGQRLRDAVADAAVLADRAVAAAGVLLTGAAHHPVRTRTDALEHLPDEMRTRLAYSFDLNVMSPLIGLFELARTGGELRDGVTPALAAASLVALCTAGLSTLDVLGVSADGGVHGMGSRALAQQIAALLLDGVAA